MKRYEERYALSGPDKFKWLVIQGLSLLGFVLFALAYGVDLIRSFLEKVQ